MTKLFSSALLILLNTIPTFAQEKVKSDSLVVHQIINFTNPYEKASFDGYYKDTTKNLSPLFFTINPNATIADFENSEKRLNDWIAVYPDKEKVAKGDRKAVKKFYKEAHDKFLDKYVNSATYPDIFTKGEYNCVSASILFGTLLQKLGIPFDVKISQSHVFLVAFPKTTPTIIETTNPTVGTVVFTDKYKEAYVKDLRSQKLISEKEYKNTTVDELFYQNFFDSKTTYLSALVGAQYYNAGLTLISNQKFEDAFINLQKSMLFMSLKNSAGALTMATASVISLHKWDSEITYSAYKQLCRLPDTLLAPEALKSEIRYIASDRMEQHSDTTSFIKVYNAIITSTTNKDIKTYFYYVYNVSMGNYFFNSEAPAKAYPYFRDAYIADTTQKDLLSIISRSIYIGYNIANSDEDFTLYLKAKNDLPALATNPSFINSFANVMLNAASKRMRAGQIDKADGLLREFEKQIPPAMLHYSSSIIDDAYGPLVKYYYAKNNNKKALEIVKRGFVFFIPIAMS